MTDLEGHLYSLSGKKVKMTCERLYPGQTMTGIIERFMVVGDYDNKINFYFDTDGRKILHGFEKPLDFSVAGDIFTFHIVDDVYYVFEIISV